MFDHHRDGIRGYWHHTVPTHWPSRGSAHRSCKHGDLCAYAAIDEAKLSNGVKFRCKDETWSYSEGKQLHEARPVVGQARQKALLADSNLVERQRLASWGASQLYAPGSRAEMRRLKSPVHVSGCSWRKADLSASDPKRTLPLRALPITGLSNCAVQIAPLPPPGWLSHRIS